MGYLISIISAVVADIITYYICKWLDSWKEMITGPHNEKTGDWHSPVFSVNLTVLISYLFYSKRDSHHFLIHLDYTTLNIVVNLP